MSASEVIIDEQALLEVAKGINSYITDYKEMLESAIRKLKLNSDDWNDEDFNSLLSAINSFMVDVNKIENGTKQLSERISKKIDAIRELHNKKI